MIKITTVVEFRSWADVPHDQFASLIAMGKDEMLKSMENWVS
jgi:hypothetical protein